VVNLIKEEYEPFPFSKTFDMMDAISRIEDPQVDARAPMIQQQQQHLTEKRREQLRRRDAADV